MESRIHDLRYHRIRNLSITNNVFILKKLRNRSNGRVRERKQRGRAHWGRRKLHIERLQAGLKVLADARRSRPDLGEVDGRQIKVGSENFERTWGGGNAGRRSISTQQG